MASFCRFGEQYVSGNLPSWFVEVWLSVECVGLFKTAQQEVVEAEADRPIRPIGMRDALVKCFHREVFRQNRSEVDKFLYPQQLALEKEGASKLVHTVRWHGEAAEREGYVCSSGTPRTVTARRCGWRV